MKAIRIGAFVGVAAAAASAHAGTLPVGMYELHNHPDGAGDPPPYGLRLDELYDVTGGKDNFTFDFDDAASYVTLDYTGSTIVIDGYAWGGRDTGTSYAVEATTGVYTFHFEYTIGVGIIGGDDDIVVTANMMNFGTILTPIGDLIDLTDKEDGGFSLRLGDENNDLGHRGFAGISGWGWLIHGPPGSSHVVASDWIFTVGDLVPAPGSLALLGVAAGGVMTRRRR